MITVLNVTTAVGYAMTHDNSGFVLITVLNATVQQLLDMLRLMITVGLP